MGRLFFFMFCVVFSGFGIGMTGMGGYGVYRWLETRDWVEIPATCKTLELERHQDEGVTYKVVCTYSYQVNSQVFDGNQPSLYSSSDNLGSYQLDLHEKLKQARVENTFKALVDTNRPSRSVLDRTYRPGFFFFSQLFALTFGSV